MTIVTPYWTTGSLASNLWQEMERLTQERSLSSSAPNTEVVESDNHFLLSLDLPGLKKEDISIEVQNKMLTVSGERKRGAHTVYRRSFTLPDTVNGESVEASYEDGVLDLYLPKVAAAQPRKIEIQSEKGGFFEQFIGSKKVANNESKNASAH